MPPPYRTRHHGQRVPVGIAPRPTASSAPDDVHLLGLPSVARQRARAERRRRRGFPARGRVPGSKRVTQERGHRLVGRRSRPPRRPAGRSGSRSVEAAQLLAASSTPTVVRRAQHRTSERVPGPRRLGNTSWTRSSGTSAAMWISSRITRRSDSTSSGRSDALRNMSAEDLDRHRQVAVEDARIEARVLPGRVRVHLAADARRTRSRCPARSRRRRPLEQHVLEEVRGPRELVGLVPRPDVEPQPDRDRPDVRHRLGNESEPRKGLRSFELDVGRATRRRQILRHRRRPSPGRRPARG